MAGYKWLVNLVTVFSRIKNFIFHFYTMVWIIIAALMPPHVTNIFPNKSFGMIVYSVKLGLLAHKYCTRIFFPNAFCNTWWKFRPTTPISKPECKIVVKTFAQNAIDVGWSFLY